MHKKNRIHAFNFLDPTSWLQNKYTIYIIAIQNSLRTKLNQRQKLSNAFVLLYMFNLKASASRGLSFERRPDRPISVQYSTNRGNAQPTV
jgi:hypothetical protein